MRPDRSHLAQQESQYPQRKHLAQLDAGKVRRMELAELGTRDVIVQKLTINDGSHRILRTANHQCRRSDVTELLTEVRITHRRAVGRIALWRGIEQHAGQTLDLLRV